MSEIKSIDGLVFKGDVDIIPSVSSCLFGDEYGKVNAVMASPILSFHSSWFESGDKGCFRAWGCDSSGNVVCGIMTRGTYDYKSHTYLDMHIIIKRMNACLD